MTTEPQDPQPTIEARVLDASELRHIGGRIETVYQAYRDEEEGWIAGLIAITEDVAPALHDALLLARAALAALEQRAVEAEERAAAMREALEPFNPGEGLLIHSKAGKPQTNAPLWCVGADAEGNSRWVTVGDFVRVHTLLGATPPRPEPPATLHDLIRQAEADRDEQSGTAAEEWCGGYLKGLRDALDALTTPPAAAPSVPDAAEVEEIARTIIDRTLRRLARDEERFVQLSRRATDEGERRQLFEESRWVIDSMDDLQMLRDALTPAAQRAPASAGSGDAKAGDDQ